MLRWPWRCSASERLWQRYSSWVCWDHRRCRCRRTRRSDRWRPSGGYDPRTAPSTPARTPPATALEQANIAKAEAELRSVEELTPLDIAIQELIVEKARQELELAQKESKRLHTLVDKGSASREDLDKKSTEVVQRTIQLKSSSE